MESIGDGFKVLEDAIKSLSSISGSLKIAVCCNGTELFNTGSKKYEMEGAKAIFDQVQMVDYYVKLCQEHPNLVLLEDPMAEEDLIGWHMLTQKFNELKLEVDIYCSELFKSDLGVIKEV